MSSCYLTEVLTDACWECEPGVYEMDKCFFQDQLEAMSFGYISSDDWYQMAREKVDEAQRENWDEAWNWDTNSYMRDEYWDPIREGIERMYGIPKDFWIASSGVRITDDDIARMYETAYIQFEAIQDGVPIEDVFA